MEVRAIRTYVSVRDDEISFHTDDTLKVIDFESCHPWYVAEFGGKVGVAPSNLLERQDNPSWFIGRATRTEAESRLQSRHDGAYVVRISSHPNLENTFTLCVKWKRNVQYYKIILQTGKYFIWVHKKFDSVNSVVEYYSANSVSKSSEIILRDKPATIPARVPKGSRGRRRRTVKALYDFTADGQDQLSFSQGEHIAVIGNVDEHWSRGERLKTGEIGLYPTSYVEIV